LSDKPNESKPLRSFEPECSDCDDIGWIGGRQCKCFFRRRITERVKSLDRRYPVFAGFDLMALTPWGHPAQTGFIPEIQANPGASVLMFGETGTGKTMIGYTLAKYAIEQGRPVVALMLDELLDQYRQQATGSDRLPDVDAESLRSAKGRYLLFLDDADKCKPTEFAVIKLFHLVNAAYETQQQIILTSNLSKSLLMQHWERAGEDSGLDLSQYGAPIIRRLCALPDAIEVDFF
jgi:DNA replication protein DnaC